MKQNHYSTDWGLQTITIRANQTTVSQLLLVLADQMEVSIAIPEEAENEIITVDYREAPARIVFQEIAQRMGLSANLTDSVLTFVSAEDEDKAFVVLRSGYIDTEKYVEILTSQLGDKARIERIDDRVIVTASQPLLRRAMEINQYTHSGADGWMLEVKVLTLTDSIRRDLGLDWTVGGSVTLTTESLHTVLDTNAFVQVIAKATQTTNDAKLLDTANLYVLEGTTSTLNRGQRIPVPRFTTTVEGSTNISGFDYVDTGFILSATAERIPGGVRMNLRPTISTVTGFVREAPITQESSITADVIVNDGDWILLSGLETILGSDSTTTLPGLPAPVFGTRINDNKIESIVLLIRAIRVHTSQSGLVH